MALTCPSHGWRTWPQTGSRLTRPLSPNIRTSTCGHEGGLGTRRDRAGELEYPEAVVGGQRFGLRDGLARQLGVEVSPIGQIVITPEQHTNVPGVYAAGDATNLHDHQLITAAHEGGQAACGANYHLYRPVQRDPGDAVEC